MRRNNLIAPFGVPLRLHWSLLLIPMLLISVYGLAKGLVVFGILFASLMFHEYCHVYVAIKLGYKVRSIAMGLGAAAGIEMDANNYKPKDELLIAGAGPAGSLFLFCIGYGAGPELNEFYLMYFTVINLALAMFNLLPMYPTDGGRIFHSILAMKLSRRTSINIAVAVSVFLASAGVVACILAGMWFMVCVFAFVILISLAERHNVLTKLNEGVY